MECKSVQKFLSENDCDCGSENIPAEIKKHIGKCGNCQRYYQLAVILNSRKGALEKAPPEVLPAVERHIYANSRPLSHAMSFDKFKFLLKPAFAGFAVMLVAVVSYAYLANKSIGHVENLTQRFNIAEFKDIKPGDVLYAGDNTTAAIRLESGNELQLHQNTMVMMNSARNITLSRGEVSVLSGDNELRIETPDGLLLAKNTAAKIHTVARLEHGSLKTETTCIVSHGELIIKSAAKEIALGHGQKAVVGENGAIMYRELLADGDYESAKSPDAMQKLFAAVQSLCDCIKAADYAPAKKGNHRQLFGKEVNENKFKVRVFWQEKGLNEMAYGPLNETNITNNKRNMNGS